MRHPIEPDSRSVERWYVADLCALIGLNNGPYSWTTDPKLDCSSVDSISSQPATPAIELEGDQLGQLGRDDCHRIFLSIQAVSRGKQGTDFAESFVRRAVHNGD